MQSPFPNFVQYVAKWACPTQGVYNTFLHVESPSFPSAKLFASDGYNLSGRLSLCSKETPSIPDADVISVVFELLSPVGQNQLDLLAGVCLTQDSFPHEKQKRDETCAGIDYVGNKDEGSSVHSSRGEKSSVRKRCRAASAPEEVQQPTNRHKIG